MTTSLRTTAPTATTAPVPSTRVRRSHLHQLDLVRGSTFLLVIFVHVLTNTNADQGVVTNGLGMAGHFTRNSFFFLTGFVLMYGNYAKQDFSTWQFWSRRLKLVAIPYLIWSVVYWAFAVVQTSGWSQLPFSLSSLGSGLAWGTSGFHLYFIFVIMQFYLLFPLILWAVRATRGHHLALLAVSGAVQIGLLLALAHLPPVLTPGTWIAENWWHAYSTFLPYQFFVFLGAVCAVHRERVDAFLRGRGWWIVGALVASAVFAVLTYRMRLDDGQIPTDASFALQPTLQPFILCAITALYAAAVWWSDRREGTPRFNGVVAYASNRSFAIFLSHVLVLQVLILPRFAGGPQVGWFEQHLGSPWATAVVYVLTVAVTLAVAECLRRAPGALYLTGRPRVPFRRSAQAT
ncbi:acyltransferase [Williamsia deligens]|uniref:Acyltransferase n=1 Tax=Williamsia deligens TaxID=321325 RepID=A0ABW3G2W3_9NOCA|nr:acyltransferase [Williamsia deligens]MCP2194198.1 Peptidoglycan/LPS O-acetylase OafA/YrhL, contains acyltransferase and SGNH-hydrolase domains [Williamsia deligens]